MDSLSESVRVRAFRNLDFFADFELVFAVLALVVVFPRLVRLFVRYSRLVV